MNGYDTLYHSESFDVLVPTYLADSVSSSGENSENESENGENSEYLEDSGDSSSSDFDGVISNQVLIQEQIDNLNSNICIMNDNLIKLNNNVLYLIGINALVLFFTLVNFAIRIFNNTLGLGKA